MSGELHLIIQGPSSVGGTVDDIVVLAVESPNAMVVKRKLV